MPAVVLPKIVVTRPTSSSDRPQVASMVSIIRPYRKRITQRSTIDADQADHDSGATTSIDEPDVDARGWSQ